MSLDANRPHSGTTATVRNGEGLVQVQVGDVATEQARFGHTDQRVEVGAIDVHLATVAWTTLTHLVDLGFEYAVSGRIGDHQRRQIGGVLGRLRLEILEIDVAAIVGR